jgi:hypothetical protein
MASISLTLIVMNGHHGVVALTRSRLLRDVGGQFVVVRGLSHVVRGQRVRGLSPVVSGQGVRGLSPVVKGQGVRGLSPVVRGQGVRGLSPVVRGQRVRGLSPVVRGQRVRGLSHVRGQGVRGLSHVRGQGDCAHVVIGPSFCGRLEVFCSVETETELKYFIEC